MARFEATHHYPATVEQLFSLLGKPDFWTEKFTAMGDQAIEVTQCAASDDGGLRIRTRREIPLELPELAKKVLGAVNRVKTYDEWTPAADDGGRRARWQVEVVGRPVAISGTAHLAPDGETGCTNHITGEITVKVPLVGGIISKLLLKDAFRSLDKEQAFNRTALSTML